VDTLTLRQLGGGTLSVPREWTDLADPDPSITPRQRAARLNAHRLLELAALLRELDLREPDAGT